MAKIVPAQTRFVVLCPSGTAVNVDIAQCLSILNKRMYRQGMNYYVEGMKFVAVGAGGNVQTACDTWITHNAWKKGYDCWIEQQREFAKQCGDAGQSDPRGKWADFKVLLDDEGLNFVTPVDGNIEAYLTGEWVYSNFVYDDAGTSRSPAIALIGGTTDDSHIGLIQSYGDSRNYPGGAPDNPAGMQTGFYAQFHGVGDIDDELADDIRDDNDLPPYDLDDYPGGASNGDYPMIQDVFATTSEFPVATAGGFLAPCGLLRLNQSNAGSAVAAVVITIGVGPYKGVMASRMGQ